jgi:hypothetical protein
MFETRTPTALEESRVFMEFDWNVCNDFSRNQVQ